MESTREYFDRVAIPFNANYDGREEFRERRRIWERLIVENLPAAGNSLCLDVGCGEGALGRIAATHGVRTVGLDQSTDMLRLAQQSANARGLENLEYVTASLPLSTPLLQRFRASAGLVLCSSVLEYVDDYQEVLRQFHVLLSAAGRLIVSVPNGYSWYRRAERLLGRLRPDSYLRHQRQVFYPETFKERLRRLRYAIRSEEFFAVPLGKFGARLAPERRGPRLSSLYVVVAEKAASDPVI